MIKKSESQARRTEADAALMELHEVVLNVLKEVEDAFGIERDLAVQSRALKIAPPRTRVGKKQPLLRRTISARPIYNSKPVGGKRTGDVRADSTK
jgi:hypothetical protein